mgnify:CR=1 FL=1|jgi:hypothetical protein
MAWNGVSSDKVARVWSVMRLIDLGFLSYTAAAHALNCTSDDIAAYRYQWREDVKEA